MRELLDGLRELDFSQSLDDYFALGGVSPGVRGVDRNGLFSTRTMYELVYGLLSKKLGITDRPILFRDLPHELKVPVIVVSTDLPEEARAELGIDPNDREWVLSTSGTPYVDVVAAIVASAAPSPFFETPTLQMVRKNGERWDRHIVRLADGGTTNKRPISLAEKGDAMALTFACVNVDGEREVTTVDLSCQDVDRYVRLNHELTEAKTEQLGAFVDAGRDQGIDRLVLSFHMSRTPEAIGVLGSDEAATGQLERIAGEVGLPLTPTDEVRLDFEDDRIGVNLPWIAVQAARLFPDGMSKPRDVHPRWTDAISAAVVALSSARRRRRLAANHIPER